MKVLVSVCNTGWIHKRVSMVLLRLLTERRHQTTIIQPTWRPYEHGLNRVVKDMCEVYTDCDFWLNIDADNPPVNNPLDLVEFDRDVLCLPTPVWCDQTPGDQPYYYNMLDEHEDGWRPATRQGLVEVDAVGSGCMLVHRRVLEMLDKPLFEREYDADGLVVRGHDYLFCQKAKEFGFRIWAHTGYPCEHYVETDLHSQITAFHEMKEPV